MNEENYSKIRNNIIPKPRLFKKLLISFLIGGLVGVIGELLIMFYSSFESLSYSESSNLMMITLIFIASFLTGLGIFDKLVTLFGAGLIIPITGFAHSTTSSAMEYKKEGLVNGIGSNIFKLSGTVILYGVVSAYIFGIVRYIIFGG